MLSLEGSGKMELLNSMYCLSKLLRAPSYFMRLISQIPDVVETYLVVRRGAPPPECHEYALNVLRQNGWDAEDPNLVDLMYWSNGPWLGFFESI